MNNMIKMLLIISLLTMACFSISVGQSDSYDEFMSSLQEEGRTNKWINNALIGISNSNHSMFLGKRIGFSLLGTTGILLSIGGTGGSIASFMSLGYRGFGTWYIAIIAGWSLVFAGLIGVGLIVCGIIIAVLSFRKVAWWREMALNASFNKDSRYGVQFSIRF